MKIPVRFLPQWNAGQMEYGRTVISVPSSEVALVIIDYMDPLDPKLPAADRPSLNRTQLFLEKIRGTQAKVIFGYNTQVANEFVQQKTLRTELAKSKRANIYYVPRRPFNMKFGDNPINEQLNSLRMASREGSPATAPQNPSPPQEGPPSHKQTPQEGPKKFTISRKLTPLKNEFVVADFYQFIHVLWKQKIKVVLYAGTSTNQCIFMKEMGVNSLRGTYDHMLPFVVVMLEDCLDSEATPGATEEQNRAAHMDLISIEAGYISSAASIEFRQQELGLESGILRPQPGPLPSPAWYEPAFTNWAGAGLTGAAFLKR